MNLALCLFKYFPYGGLQRDFLKIAKLAIAQGHQVTCYTMSWQGEKPAGLKVIIVRGKGLSNHARCRHFAQQLTKCLAKKPYDKVLGFNRLPGLDFYFAGDACFQASMRAKHGLIYRLLPRYRTFLALEKSVFNPKSKTQILLLDPKQKTVFQKYYHTEDNRFHVVPPGVGQPELLLAKATARARTQLNIPQDATTRWLLMVGQDLQRKGLDRNLKALANLPPALREKTYLLVVGTHKLADFKKMAHHLNLSEQVLFLGARDDVYTLMQAADILLHPAYQETAGMVLIEALVNGLPVLVTDNCGYAFHIAAAHAGVLAPGKPFNQVQYNQILSTMLQDLPHATWHSNALNYSKHQNLSRMAETILALIS